MPFSHRFLIFRHREVSSSMPKTYWLAQTVILASSWPKDSKNSMPSLMLLTSRFSIWTERLIAVPQMVTGHPAFRNLLTITGVSPNWETKQHQLLSLPVDKNHWMKPFSSHSLLLMFTPGLSLLRSAKTGVQSATGPRTPSLTRPSTHNVLAPSASLTPL